jgi:hypothetical protein
MLRQGPTLGFARESLWIESPELKHAILCLLHGRENPSALRGQKAGKLTENTWMH